MRDAVADHIWSSGAVPARMARAVLTPFGWLFGGVVAARNLAFDKRWLRSHPVALPTISIGNLTVGGTGKTPVSAWVVAELRARGANPAIVMRGYGGDEPLVHERLNGGVPVVVSPDRVAGVAKAAEGGATVAVLDDAFQHRRARRDVDIVLLSADRFGPVRPLPAGPWREPLTALSRAQFVVVTRKSASLLRAKELLQHALRFAPKAAGAIVYLAPDALVAADGSQREPVEVIRNTTVVAVSAIGDPRAFESQLRNVGALVTSLSYADHHRFTAEDVVAILSRAKGATRVICTLKDAVKIGRIWPRTAPSLWYLSQRVVVEAGGEAFDALFSRFASR